MKHILTTGLSVTALILAACGEATPPAQDAVPSDVEAKMAGAADEVKVAAEDIGNRGAVMMAIQGLDRSEADKADDEIRKAAEVLQFTGIMPGMTVLEIEAGGGYYTEILSGMVGENGKVYHQNPAPFDAFMDPKDVEARFGEDGKRLGNVTRIKSNFDVFDVPDNSIDVATWFLGPHELFFTPDDGNTFGSPDASYAEIFRVLKPGGKFIALDHAAAAGAPETTGNSTHRIDPGTVKSRAEAAGLVLTKSSNALANAEDDLEKNVFDPTVRRKTDRFLHMYVKPE